MGKTGGAAFCSIAISKICECFFECDLCDELCFINVNRINIELVLL